MSTIYRKVQNHYHFWEDAIYSRCSYNGAHPHISRCSRSYALHLLNKFSLYHNMTFFRQTHGFGHSPKPTVIPHFLTQFFLSYSSFKPKSFVVSDEISAERYFKIPLFFLFRRRQSCLFLFFCFVFIYYLF